MGKFDAKTAVEAMEYDFTAYGGSKGVIAEPTTKQVETFFNGIREVVKDLRKKIKDTTGHDIKEFDNLDEEDVKPEQLQALEAVDQTMMSEQQDRLAALIAEVCNHQPSAKELQNLPFRLFSAFNQWIVGEIRPNQKTPATTK